MTLHYGRPGGTLASATQSSHKNVRLPFFGLASSVYTDDLTIPDYTSLDALDGVGVAAWSPEFTAVPEPSSIVTMLVALGMGVLMRWRYCRRKGLPYLARG